MLKRTERRASLGVLFLAAMLLDLLLWVFVLVGVENVTIPPDWEELHYLAFVFPYSHGLLATVIWSALAGGLVWLVRRRRGARPSAAVPGLVTILLVAAAGFWIDAPSR
jgi:Mg/Co/Ni transporter MgtE